MSDLLLTDPFTLTSIIMSPIIQYVAFSGHKRALAHKHKLFCDTCWKNWGCHSFWEDGFANVYWLLVLARQGPTPFALIFIGPMPLSVCRLWQQNVFSLYIYCENGLFWNNQHLRCFFEQRRAAEIPQSFLFFILRVPLQQHSALCLSRVPVWFPERRSAPYRAMWTQLPQD